MTSVLPTARSTEIVYPSSDDEPLAETSVHVDAIIDAVVILRQLLANRAIVLADQFLYYAQGFPKLRVAPDIMVIFDVPPGARDNYKTWEEGQVPAVIFEITSEGTRKQDQDSKKTLYAQLEVQKYWLFDPKGEWIPEQLRGYRLQGDGYAAIADGRSEPLQLRLQVDGALIGFYREDTGEKLLAPGELVQALRAETLARQSAEERAEQERHRADRAELQVARLQAQLKALGVNPEDESI